MKIINLVCLLLIGAVTLTHAQVTFPKGTQSLQGNGSYYRNTNEYSGNDSYYPASSNSKVAQSNASIEWGYFIKDNLALQFGLYGGYTMSENSYSYQSYINNVITTAMSTNINSTYEGQLGMGITRYYPIGDTRLAFLVSASIRGGMGRTHLKQTIANYNDEETNRNVFSGGIFLVPQLLYQLTPKWSATAGLGGFSYRYSQTFSLGNNDYKATNSGLSSSLGLSSLSVGLTYFIR